MAINIHGGHNRHVEGAVGQLNEVTEDRKVKDALINILKVQGQTVYDCTDDTGRTQNDILKNIVKKCNQHSASIDISIHLNAGGGEGVEVLCKGHKMDDVASRVCNNIAKTLDIKNRGVKYSDNLYVLNATKSPAILIECCFVDSQKDATHWNAQKCAQAIAEAVLKKSVIVAPQPTPSKANVPFQMKVANVKQGEHLNIREDANASSPITGSLKSDDPNIYTIVEVKNGWGRLKSGQGWIYLDYTKKV